MGFFVLFVNYLLIAFQIAILARVIVSWLPIGADSPFAPIVRMIYEITEPILGPIRRLIPGLGMFDLSPMIALVLIILIQNYVLPALVNL